MKNHDLLRAAYAAFNGRDIEGALAAMQPEVEWANGMEGGTLRGRLAVREYWTRQWSILDPRVEPLSFEEDGTGRVMVRAHQVVRDLRGTVIADRTVCHTYAFEDDLIRSMEIGDQYSGGECRASALTSAQP
jgi:ketosteroid isomerase-like protein